MSTTPPQFGTAEYKGATSGETCRACKQTITGEYYRVNGVQACAACVGKVKEQMPKDTHAAFMRGMLFGVGGAIAGLIVYSVFGIVTGIVIGYVSLAVGWLVGKAIRLGSKGVGGRRYQIVGGGGLGWGGFGGGGTLGGEGEEEKEEKGKKKGGADAP